MILVTTEAVTGRDVARTLGLVVGTSTRCAGFRHEITAWIKGILGGEVEEHTKTLAEAREQALDRMREHAHAMGANAVVGLRITSVDIANNVAEILAYGTAVVLAEEMR